MKDAQLKAAILDSLSSKPQTATTLAAVLFYYYDLSLTVQKVSSLARQLVSAGLAQVAVPKKGKQKGYFI